MKIMFLESVQKHVLVNNNEKNYFLYYTKYLQKF